MNYYDLDFYYPGPYGDPEDKEANQALQDAKKIISKIADQLAPEISILHAYSWPDGSLFKYARAEEHIDIQTRMNQILQGTGLTVRVRRANSNTDPHKLDCKTLVEYFEKSLSKK